MVSATFLNSVSNTSLSPDGLPNYGLRSVPQYVAGVNTPELHHQPQRHPVDHPRVRAYFLDPHQADPRVQDWNFTIEKEIMANTVVRATYLGNHVSRMLQQVNYNDSTPSYIWYATQKTAASERPYTSAVATTPIGQSSVGRRL